jgi:hypothetical protein
VSVPADLDASMPCGAMGDEAPLPRRRRVTSLFTRHVAKHFFPRAIPVPANVQ